MSTIGGNQTNVNNVLKYDYDDEDDNDDDVDVRADIHLQQTFPTVPPLTCSSSGQD